MWGIKNFTFAVLARCIRFFYALRLESAIRRIPIAVSFIRFAYRRLKPEGTVMVTVEGHKMFVDTRDYGVAFRLLSVQTFEPKLTEVFKRILRPGDVVVDIGANIGYFTLLASGLVGELGRVYAFEPAPDNFALLNKNLTANASKNVYAIQKALSSHKGSGKLLLEAKNWGSHRIVETVADGQSVEVEMISMDEFFTNGNQRVDAIKMDAEGSEIRILHGASGLLRNNPDLALFSELHPKVLRAAGHCPNQYLRMLVDQGFVMYAIDEIDRQVEHLVPDQLEALVQDLLHRPVGRDYLTLVCLRRERALTARWDPFHVCGLAHGGAAPIGEHNHDC